MKKNKITATDALYGFCAWLTTREKSVTFSSKHNAGTIADLINTFIKANNLPDPSKKYPNNFVMPKGV